MKCEKMLASLWVVFGQGHGLMYIREAIAIVSSVHFTRKNENRINIYIEKKKQKTC